MPEMMYIRTMGRTIHIQDAALPSTGFSLMLKPVGSACNLGCRYCYYLDKGTGGRMSLEVLEKAIRSYADACHGPELNFIWHGGEPLLLGVDFYRAAVALERRYSSGRPVFNSIQTNGTLMTPEWAAFFRKHNFLVGISIDGPRDIHDQYRQDRSGQPCFDRVVRGLGYLRDAGAQFNTLTTVNHYSEGRGADVYGFLKQLGSHHMQFLPVMEFGSDTSVSALGFGRFMADVFDVWVRGDVGQYYVQLFDAALAAWCGLPPGLCTLGRRCEGTAVIENGGDVYLCDHCVDAAHRLGNIMETPLSELMARADVESFAAAKMSALPPRCRACQWLPACNGECPVHRPSADSVNALCEGYRLFFDHAAPTLDRMRALIASGQAPGQVMSI